MQCTYILTAALLDIKSGGGWLEHLVGMEKPTVPGLGSQTG